jgi:hypothetical protein
MIVESWVMAKVKSDTPHKRAEMGAIDRRAKHMTTLGMSSLSALPAA